MLRRRWKVVFFALLGNLLLTSAATAKLRVGTKDFPPFVFIHNSAQKPTGYSIDLWRKISNRLGQEDVELVVIPTIDGLLEAVETQELDLAIAGISITAQREETLNFSHSFYETGLQILVLETNNNPVTLFFSYTFSWNNIRAIGTLFGIALISAHLLWFFERRVNPEMFPHTYLKGIWEAFWWSLVTATTVGYGDKSPKGFVGRLVAISWMLGAVFVLAHFTAAVTAHRLESQISSVEDLSGKRVGAVVGTTSAQYLSQYPLKLVPFTNREEAYQALETEKIEAIVDDAPTLLYFAAKNPDFRVVGNLFAKQSYAVVLPQNSPYQEKIDRIILQLKEEGEIEALNQKWFPQTEAD